MSKSVCLLLLLLLLLLLSMLYCCTCCCCCWVSAAVNIVTEKSFTNRIKCVVCSWSLNILCLCVHVLGCRSLHHLFPIVLCINDGHMLTVQTDIVCLFTMATYDKLKPAICNQTFWITYYDIYCDNTATGNNIGMCWYSCSYRYCLDHKILHSTNGLMCMNNVSNWQRMAWKLPSRE